MNAWKRAVDELPPPDLLIVMTDGVQGWLGCRQWTDEGEGGYVYTSVDDSGICWNGLGWEFDANWNDEYQPTHWHAMPSPKDRHEI